MTPQLRTRLALPALTLIAAAVLSACGGGGGTSNPSAAPTGVSAQAAIVEGPVTGFGSTIVNGVRFDDSRASITDEDGNPRSLADLRIGTMVRIQGSADDSAGKGSATSVMLMPSLRGKVESVSTGASTLVVLGQTVHVDANTVFDGAASLAAIAVGDAVEVHGLLASDGSFNATLIEKFNTQPATFVLRAVIKSVDTGKQTLSVGALVVDYSKATIRPNGAQPQAGQLVAVRASAAPSGGVLVADRIRIRSARDDFSITSGFVEFKGILDAAPDANGRTTVSGIPVDLTGAKVEGAGNLVAGQRVEIKGVESNGVIQASRIRFEGVRAAQIGGSNELYGLIANFTSASSFKVNGVAVDASQAVFDHGTASNLGDGVYVEIKGNMATGANGTVLVATRVEFKAAPGRSDDDNQGNGMRELYGAVENFTAPASFTVNGVKVDGANATFDDGQASDLRNGVYVEVKGSFSGDVLIATEIEFKGSRSNPTPAPAPAPGPGPSVANGLALYNAIPGASVSCATCHTADPNANVAKVLNGANDPGEIADAIAENKGGMGVLKGLLTAAQLRDISAYLAAPNSAPPAPAPAPTPTPPPPPPPPPPPSPPPPPPPGPSAQNGKVLYNAIPGSAVSCATCHTATPANNVANVLNGANNPNRIASAIAGNAGGMGVLSGKLTAAQLQDIAAYLATPNI
jgi:mono/diheme cytochrome c family protein